HALHAARGYRLAPAMRTRRLAVVSSIAKRRELLQPQLLENMQIFGWIVVRPVRWFERVEHFKFEGLGAELVPVLLEGPIRVRAHAELCLVTIEHCGQVDTHADQ